MKKTKSAASDAPLRGEALVRKAIEAGVASGRIRRPEPVPAEVLARLELPNGEPLSPGLRALLAFDAAWLGAGIDLEDAVFEALDLADLIEQELGEETVPFFGEAYEILADDCILLGGGADSRRFLYVGNPDAAGEYPVITVDTDDVPWIGGFVPFDVWVAQHLGALPEEKVYGWVPKAYEACPKDLARRNGDGRTSFEPSPASEDDGEDE